MREREVEIHKATGADVGERIEALAALLKACVDDGASVSFIQPFSKEDAERFWRDKVAPGVQGGRRLLLVAMTDGALAGSVQLDVDTPPNQAHRAEVCKLLVHPAFRRRGIARRLMTQLEAEARALGRTLITLDTRTGDKAEPLYSDLGYQTAGVIPGYARDPREARLDATTYMYKRL
jgi:ribosomal protein S18 acetylase RimI-like enzyme